MKEAKMNVYNLGRLFSTCSAVLVVLLLAQAGGAVGAPPGCSEKYKTYTVNADFDEGILSGVEHDSVSNQLQIAADFTTLPLIWVPNWGQGTVSKINTETGDELGRYRVSGTVPSRLFNDPSRTTVDAFGNCWVGNRCRGTVVKIGLFENGQFIDRNGNGIIETSQDLNGDGNIDLSEMYPWGEDECVLWEVSLISGNEGTYVPGTFPGPYDEEYLGTAPRGLAIDANNNLWAGTYDSRLYYIDGATGQILHGPIDVSPHTNYGAVIDENGILWSASGPRQANPQPGIDKVLRFDPSTDTFTTLDLGHWAYGLGLDYDGHLFVTSWDDGKITKIDVNDSMGTIVWTKDKSELQDAGVRGVTCTADNNFWVASTDNDRIYRYDNDGNLIASIDVALLGGIGAPTGVAVDAAGKVWACNYLEHDGEGARIYDDHIHRIDPATNTVDLSKEVLGSMGHYTYSDMTGIVLRTITATIGIWSVVYDSGIADTPWEKVSWSSDEPGGTSVEVKVRSSHDQMTWSAWETADNDVLFSSPPDGRYFQVEVTLRILSGNVSPILYDLTITRKDPTITATADTGGSTSPSGVVAVDCGSNQMFTIDPLGCYNIEDVFVDSVSVIGFVVIDPATGTGTYTFQNVTSDHTIHATFEAHCSEVYHIPLHEGWNLISIPVHLLDNALLAVLQSIVGQYNSVWAYDAVSHQWERYIVGAPDFLNTLETIEVGKGYWIDMINADTLILIGDTVAGGPVSLALGWNLVGYNCLSELPLADALSSIAENYVSAWAYDTVSRQWERYIVGAPDFLNTLVSFKPWKGYWIDTTTAGIWTLDACPSAAPSARLATCRVSTQRPEIPYTIWGNVEIDGVRMTSRAGTVFLKVDNVIQSSYRLGEAARYGNFYALDVPTTADSSAQVELYVQIGDTLVKAAPIVPGRPGEVIRHDLSVQIIPESSRLYQNYPNPFNPDTWIPYQLREAAQVTVRLYTETGQLVRTINLGYKEAGSYVTKDVAVHWNGENEAGEHVSSGVYFYTIQAGNYSATRKMTVAQ